MTAKKRTKKPRPKTPEDLNWERMANNAAGEVQHRHRSGEWIVESASVLGYGSSKPLKKKQYLARYVGPERTDPPKRFLSATLIKAKVAVQKIVDARSSNTDLRERAVLSLRLGRTALAIDIVFDYIDKRFDELEKDLDERFENLRISMD